MGRKYGRDEDGLFKIHRPRYSWDSTIEREKAGDKKRFVPDGFRNRKDKWSDRQWDLLLELRLVYELPLVGEFSLMSLLQRTRESLWTQERELGTCYRLAKELYEPRNRTDRSGRPWTYYDYYYLSLAVNKTGRRKGAYRPSYLAKLLARSEKEITSRLRQLAGSSLGFVKERIVMDAADMARHAEPHIKRLMAQHERKAQHGRSAYTTTEMAKIKELVEAVQSSKE